MEGVLFVDVIRVVFVVWVEMVVQGRCGGFVDCGDCIGCGEFEGYVGCNGCGGCSQCWL